MTFLYLALPFIIGEFRFAFESGPAWTVLSLSLAVLGYTAWELYLRWRG